MNERSSMYLLIDNYDSFTHNLYHLFGACGKIPIVERNDARSAKEMIRNKPKAVIISPGPGHPKSAGICTDLVKLCSEEDIPVLGVCLGHQIIGYAFGATVIRNHEIVHGKLSLITHTGTGVLKAVTWSDCKTLPFTSNSSVSCANNKLLEISPAEIRIP